MCSMSKLLLVFIAFTTSIFAVHKERPKSDLKKSHWSGHTLPDPNPDTMIENSKKERKSEENRFEKERRKQEDKDKSKEEKKRNKEERKQLDKEKKKLEKMA